MQLTLFLRSLLKDKQFTILNILGLALGICISIILVLILRNDFGYDKFHSNYQKIYRISGHYKTDLFDSYWAGTPRDSGCIKYQHHDVEKTITRMSYRTRLA